MAQSKYKDQEMNKNFRPTRVQILKALEDQENGRKIEPDMAAYLEEDEKSHAESSKNQQEIASAIEMVEWINSTVRSLSYMTEKTLTEVEQKYPRVIRLVRKAQDDRLITQPIKVPSEVSIAMQLSDAIESTLKRLSHMPEEILVEIAKKHSGVIQLAQDKQWERLFGEKLKKALKEKYLRENHSSFRSPEE